MLELVKRPDRRLNEVCSNVTNFQHVRSLVDEALTMMYAENGMGLAGPQFGFMQRLIFVDPSAGERSKELIVMINPMIDSFSEEQTIDEEACLSLPGVRVFVPRSTFVNVRYYDLNENEIQSTMSGLTSRIVQHEIDHLNGITLKDRKATNEIFKKRVKRSD